MIRCSILLTYIFQEFIHANKHLLNFNTRNLITKYVSLHNIYLTSIYIFNHQKDYDYASQSHYIANEICTYRKNICRASRLVLRGCLGQIL